MKSARALVIVLALAAAGARAAADLKKDDPLTWLGVDPFQFGCWVEKELAFRGSYYNCASASGQVPKSADGAAGPHVPTDKFKELKAGIADLTLTWEKNRLQEVSITLDRKLTESGVRKYLGVKSLKNPRPNVANIKFNECAGKTCVLLQNRLRAAQ